MSKNDQYYISKILDGDENKYSTLINKYKDLIFTLCYRITKDKENAEEAAQDTFIKAYKSLASFKGDSKFSSWLYRIAYNTSLDMVKKNKRQILQNNNIEINDIEDMDSTVDILEKTEFTEQIKNSIKKLNNEEAFILTLYYYEELSIKEIAEITNLKANNIKVKIHRSRQKLMLILKKELPKEIIERYENR